jgi:hypothetical protein
LSSRGREGLERRKRKVTPTMTAELEEQQQGL